MENAVVQQIRKKITRSKFGEIFFVSSFPQYNVEYVTKLLAIFEKDGLITRIAKGVYVKARKTRFGILYPSTYELVTEIAKRDKAKVIPSGATAADLGLHLAYMSGGTPYYEEARTVMECEIMSALHQSSDDFRNDTPRKLYANFKAGIHTVYIAEIVGAWKKSGKGVGR